MNVMLDCWEKFCCCNWVVVYKWMIIATKDLISAIVYCSCWSHRLRKKMDFGMHFFFVDWHKIDFGMHFFFVDWHKIDFGNHLFSFIKQLFSVDLLALYSRQKGRMTKVYVFSYIWIWNIVHKNQNSIANFAKFLGQLVMQFCYFWFLLVRRSYYCF
jgi:hypothetical protein